MQLVTPAAWRWRAASGQGATQGSGRFAPSNRKNNFWAAAKGLDRELLLRLVLDILVLSRSGATQALWATACCSCKLHLLSKKLL
jgi:hypothetical protein